MEKTTEKNLTEKNLALFVGCQVIHEEDFAQECTLVGIDILSEFDSVFIKAGSVIISCHPESVKPILTPLADMPLKHKVELLKLEWPDIDFIIESISWSGSRYSAKFRYFNKVKNEWSETGVGGTLALRDFNPVQFRFLLDNHYDLFEWIPKRLAVDKKL